MQTFNPLTRTLLPRSSFFLTSPQWRLFSSKNEAMQKWIKQKENQQYFEVGEHSYERRRVASLPNKPKYGMKYNFYH